MSITLDNIQIQINILQNEKTEAEQKYRKYKNVVKRLDDILYHKGWFTFADTSIAHKLEYISDHYIGRNGVYDRMERNPESAEGKFALVFIGREQVNRKEFADFFSAIQESYGRIVRQRDKAAALRDEYQQTIAIKEQALQEQKQAYRAQEERERREREEAARRAAEEAARRAAEEAARRAAEEAARRAAEQQKAMQEAAERMAAAQQTVSTGRARRRR